MSVAILMEGAEGHKQETDTASDLHNRMLGRRRAGGHMGVDAAGNRARQAASLTVAWCLACTAATLHCCRSLEPEAARLFMLYFQPVAPPLLMLWLWAHNVRSFEYQHLPYEDCFSSRDRKLLLPSPDIARLALAATAVTSTWACVFAWLASGRLYILAEYVPILLYCSLAALAALPLNVLGRATRLFFLETCQRVALPLQAVSWSDFLLADMLTSLAKSSGDAAQALCAMATGPTLQRLVAPAFRGTPSVCAPLATLPLAAVCAPYAIRFVQCLIVFRTTGNKAQVANALKYCSAFPSLILSLMEHESHVHGRPFSKFGVWIAAAVFNSAFSYYWDVEMDWDMPWLYAAAQQQQHQTLQHPPHHLHPPQQRGPWPRRLLQHAKRWLLPSLRPRPAFAPPWYVWACLSNLVLRLAWTHRLLGNIEASSAVSLTIALLEVFRRYQWAFIRVETELRKLRGGSAGGAAAAVSEAGEGFPLVHPHHGGKDGALAPSSNGVGSHLVHVVPRPSADAHMHGSVVHGSKHSGPVLVHAHGGGAGHTPATP